MKLRVIEINQFNLVAGRHEVVELGPVEPKIIRDPNGKEVMAVRMSSLVEEPDVVELLLRVVTGKDAKADAEKIMPIPFKLKGTGSVEWPKGHPNRPPDPEAE